ncbi:MAG: cohesin domain-containing protein [Candidatus Dojkabacteria bacterium]|nr:cohesin domain-containing protein [Candidatus Dojkabacteria bacterium]
MIVKKIISISILTILTILIPITTVSAASPMFYFYPESGVIKNVDDGFTVDVLIDSAGESLTEARMVFNFDPRLIQVSKASRNNSLFEEWPDDESTLDNENGVVMLTGFTQSGSGDLYKTSGDPDVFARIEFEIVTDDTEVEIPLEWEFTGSDDLFQTVLLADGSPPQNVLDTRPTNATLRIGQLTQTAIDPKYIPFIFGGLLILVAGVIITSKPEMTRKKYGTVVVYDD